uniref:Uncharacterized protein n=1 Tax=Timema genevievae TaxID=629358 RepID=A0A7R9K0Q0_TIMGE|nr:unnamed protein product [Timema genevievae]
MFRFHQGHNQEKRRYTLLQKISAKHVGFLRHWTLQQNKVGHPSDMTISREVAMRIQWDLPSPPFTGASSSSNCNLERAPHSYFLAISRSRRRSSHSVAVSVVTVLRQKRNAFPTIDAVDTEDELDEDGEFVGLASTETNYLHDKWLVNTKFCGKDLSDKIDTGADPLHENGPRVQQEPDELPNNSSSSPRRESILPVHPTPSEVATEVPQLDGSSPKSSTPAQRSQRSRKPVDRLDL